MFRSNPRQVYSELSGNQKTDQPVPNSDESKQFWSMLWDRPLQHNNNCKWLNEITNQTRQKNITITSERIHKLIRRMPNWKASGIDQLHGFWIKYLNSLHQRLVEHLQACLEMENVPDWMTEGTTVLIMKDESKGPVVSNYRPIACLPTTYKLLTGVLAETIYEHISSHGELPIEQKGCKKKSRGTKDQLLIDKMILKNCKKAKKNLHMAWIDYKKVYDMVPQSWILKCLELSEIAANTSKLIENSMKTWRTTLVAGSTVLGKVNIRRGIFQGNSLSPLLFVLAMIPLTKILRKHRTGYIVKGEGIKINHLLFMDDLKLYGKNTKEIESLIQTVRKFSEDIKMEFGIDKCAIMEMKSGKMVNTPGCKLPNESTIKGLNLDDNYKYLGILEADDIKHEEMKNNIKKEYFNRIRRILKSKLNAGNIVTAMNTWAISLIRYGAGIVKWNKEELQTMDRKTRKMMTIHGALHPKADVDRLYIPRKDGGRGLISIEDCVNDEELSLAEYIENSNEDFLKCVKEEGFMRETNGISMNTIKSKRQRARFESWKSKEMHGQFLRQTSDI